MLVLVQIKTALNKRQSFCLLRKLKVKKGTQEYLLVNFTF